MHVDIEPVQLVVLLLQLFEPFDIRGLYSSVRGCPLVIGYGVDAVAPPDLVDGAVGIGLLQNAGDLGFGKYRLA